MGGGLANGDTRPGRRHMFLGDEQEQREKEVHAGRDRKGKDLAPLLDSVIPRFLDSASLTFRKSYLRSPWPE